MHYGEADKGGHFAALEQPEILFSEIRTGLRTLRWSIMDVRPSHTLELQRPVSQRAAGSAR